MRRSALFAALIALGSSIVGMFIPGPVLHGSDITGREGTSVFEVAVVGRGVSDPTYKDRPALALSKNRQAGLDIWLGANAARHINAPFELISRDDDADRLKAKKIARELVMNPRILAVIGHASSGSTRVAAEVYAEAGIPLILPVATAQAAVYPTDVQEDELDNPSLRLTNCFRLPPSDDKGQAPAIVSLIQRIREKKVQDTVIHNVQEMKVHIVLATSADAEEYSVPLGRKIETLLKQNGYPLEVVDVENKTSSIEQIVSHIERAHTDKDLIIFCGYMEGAEDFLAKLDELYQKHINDHIKPTKPTLIFTDAAPGLEDSPKGFSIYRTAYLDTRKCPKLPIELQSQAGNGGESVSAELAYGYDSVQMIQFALKGCKTISRRCLLDQLRNTPIFPGSCFGYAFRDGESVISSYYVFRSVGAPDLSSNEVNTTVNGAPPSLQVFPSEIIRLRSTLETREP